MTLYRLTSEDGLLQWINKKPFGCDKMKKVFFNYLEINDAKLFTVICLPMEFGKFPTVIMRTP